MNQTNVALEQIHELLGDWETLEMGFQGFRSRVQVELLRFFEITFG